MIRLQPPSVIIGMKQLGEMVHDDRTVCLIHLDSNQLMNQNA